MGILEQAMLWKLLKKKNEKEIVESEKEKKLLKSCGRIRSPKVEKRKKIYDFFKKIVKRKSLKSLKKNVYDCGNKMLSSIALKIGSFVLKIVWKVCP